MSRRLREGRQSHVRTEGLRRRGHEPATGTAGDLMEAGYLMDGSDFCEGYAGVRWAVGPAGSTASTAGRLEMHTNDGGTTSKGIFSGFGRGLSERRRARGATGTASRATLWTASFSRS